MPNLTGHLKSNSIVQTLVTLNDKPGHQLLLSVTHAHQSSNDQIFNNTRHTGWGTADLINGNGRQQGYFHNEHPNGDQSSGSYECTVSTVNGQLMMEGSWRYTHGTGLFAGITGNGTFKGRQPSPMEMEVSFEGSYQLKSSTRAA